MIRKLLLVAIALGACAFVIIKSLELPAPLNHVSDDFMLPAVTVINPGEAVRKNHTLVVRDGKIVRFAAFDLEFRRDKNTTIYRNMFVLPGLIDAHSHLPPDNPLKLTSYFLLLNLAHGVTTIREAGDVDGTAVAVAKRGMASGAFPGPRLLACGPLVGGEPAVWANTQIMNSAADAMRVAKEIKAQGFDCIKSYDHLSQEEINALKNAANAVQLPVMGHVPESLRYEEAVIPDTQHLFGVPLPENLVPGDRISRSANWDEVDDARMAEIVAATKRFNIINTPTLVSTFGLLGFRNYEAMQTDHKVKLLPRVYRDVVWSPDIGLPAYRGITKQHLIKLERAFEKKKQLVKRLYDAKARLQIGTDTQLAFVVPGHSMHQEMELFHRSGIPLDEVWRIATVKNAQGIGRPELGRVYEGGPADLLIFEKDPTQDIKALETLVAVVAQGKLYPIQELEEAVERHRLHYHGWVADLVSVAAGRILVWKAVTSTN